MALLGLLVRHRGPVAAGIACGIYAVYPDALVAAHTFMLEPWLNLFCLLGALAVFDGDRLAERPAGWPGAARRSASRWPSSSGPLVPLAVVGLLLLRRPRRLGLLAAGAAAGLAVPVLPFLALAPTGLIKDVVVSQYLRADARHQPSLPRLADLAGWSLSPHLSSRATAVIVLAIAALGAAGYLAACWAGARRPAALDAYALIGVVAVVAMLLWPYGYWPHYGAVAGPFIALVLALPAGLLRPAEHRRQIVPLLAVSAAAAVLIAALGVRQFTAETQLQASTALAAQADRLIPPGSCVVTDYSSLTISADRFDPAAADCPVMVDSYGTLLALTGGRKMSPARASARTRPCGARSSRSPPTSGSNGTTRAASRGPPPCTRTSPATSGCSACSTAPARATYRKAACTCGGNRRPPRPPPAAAPSGRSQRLAPGGRAPPEPGGRSSGRWPGAAAFREGQGHRAGRAGVLAEVLQAGALRLGQQGERDDERVIGVGEEAHAGGEQDLSVFFGRRVVHLGPAAHG